jgi:NADPH:quinone reductase
VKSAQLRQLSDSFDAVTIEDVPTPTPGPGQVRVRMRMSPINPSDHNFIHGTYKSALERLIWNRGRAELSFDPERKRPHPTPPYALGGEGVGVVDAAGSGLLARRLLGKRVAVASGPPQGTWQEHTVVDAKKAIPVPDSWTDAEAAMAIINPLSAVLMLRDVLDVRRGTFLVQDAAGSALAKTVIAMSKRIGFETINVVRDGKHTQALKALGARHVVETDSTDLRDEVARITSGRGADYAMDCIGGPIASELVSCLGLGGHLVLYGTLGAPSFELHSRDLMMPVARISGFFAGNHIAMKSTLGMLRALRELKAVAHVGLSDVQVREVVPLDDVRRALEASVTPGATGKVLLKLGE